MADDLGVMGMLKNGTDREALAESLREEVTEVRATPPLLSAALFVRRSCVRRKRGSAPLDPHHPSNPAHEPLRCGLWRAASAAAASRQTAVRATGVSSPHESPWGLCARSWAWRRACRSASWPRRAWAGSDLRADHPRTRCAPPRVCSRAALRLFAPLTPLHFSGHHPAGHPLPLLAARVLHSAHARAAVARGSGAAGGPRLLDRQRRHPHPPAAPAHRHSAPCGGAAARAAARGREAARRHA